MSASEGGEGEMTQSETFELPVGAWGQTNKTFEREKLHFRRVNEKYDILGATIMTKRVFDNIKEDQEKWMRQAKVDVPKNPQIPHANSNIEDTTLATSPTRELLRFPFLRDPSPSDATKNFISSVQSDNILEQKYSKMLGESTYKESLRQRAQRTGVGKQPPKSPSNKVPIERNKPNSNNDDENAIEKRNYEVFELMINKSITNTRCTCNATCKKDTKAVIKCFTCLKYDSLLQGNFCERCFAATHPSYRVKHNFMRLPYTPNEPDWDSRMRQLAAERKYLEYKEISNLIQNVLPDKHKALEGPSLQDRIKAASDGLDASATIIKYLSESLPKQIDLQSAVLKLQSFWRMNRQRREFRSIVKSTVIRLKDESTGKYYYHNKRTGETQWEKPKIINTANKATNTKEAARIIQKMYRSGKARTLARKILLMNLELHKDEKSGKTFYYNIKTKRSSWERPSLLLDSDVVPTPRTRQQMAKSQTHKKLPESQLTKADSKDALQSQLKANDKQEKIVAAALAELKTPASDGTLKQVTEKRLTDDREDTATVRDKDMDTEKPPTAKLNKVHAFASGEKPDSTKVEDLDNPLIADLTISVTSESPASVNKHEGLETPQPLELEPQQNLESTEEVELANESTITIDNRPIPLQAESPVGPKLDTMPSIEPEATPTEVNNQEEIENATRKAAILVQKLVRRRRARKQLRDLVSFAWEKHIDPETGQEFFYNIKTNQSSWVAPSMLKSTEVFTPRSRIRKAIVKSRIEQGKFRWAKNMSREDAATTIQNFYRRTTAMYQLRNAVLDVWERHIDPESGATYYYNRKTNVSSWTVPTLLRRALSSRAHSRRRQRNQSSSNRRKRRGSLSGNGAALSIQSWYRSCLARARLKDVLRAIWEKHIDPDSGYAFYYNTNTGETTWVPPFLLCEEDLPVSSQG